MAAFSLCLLHVMHILLEKALLCIQKSRMDYKQYRIESLAP